MRRVISRGAPRVRAALCASACALASSACTWAAGGDALTTRCLEALRYRSPAIAEVRVLAAELEPRDRLVTIRFESSAPGPGRISCQHEPGNRWNLQRIRIGDEPLSRAAVALVNAELLLRDLTENPQRFRPGA